MAAERKADQPKMMIAIEHLYQAEASMNDAMNVLSSIVLDWQKGADFIAHYRESLIKTVELAGGDVQQSIEHQIKEYMPPKHRNGDNGNAVQTRES